MEIHDDDLSGPDGDCEPCRIAYTLAAALESNNGPAVSAEVIDCGTVSVVTSDKDSRLVVYLEVVEKATED
ncbi:MAG: hypothetical protein IPO08_20065 [Xanthomonadales bacterium]|nr:hypothetical protein [Xanthomonadales bacterium]